MSALLNLLPNWLKPVNYLVLFDCESNNNTDGDDDSDEYDCMHKASECIFRVHV